MPEVNVTYVVPCVPQQRTMSCWAAAGASLKTWKTSQSWDEDSIVRLAGDPFPILLQTDAGLGGTAVADFAVAVGMLAEAPQDWDVQGYADLLRKVGPVWAGAALIENNRVYGHVRIIMAVVGDGTMDGTNVSLFDPDGGRYYEESVAQLNAELLRFSQIEIDPQVELRPQIIHCF